jgi:ABC-type bacteriocin/lantibiotic exporter with double-glycine peptidase domain
MSGREMVVETKPPADALPVGRGDLAVHLEGVAFHWRERSSFVLHVAELSVRPGERIFIYGPSGSGKSTLLSLIGGVVTPQRGVVSVLGESIACPGRNAMRSGPITSGSSSSCSI